MNQRPMNTTSHFRTHELDGPTFTLNPYPQLVVFLSALSTLRTWKL
jgi:hypothetical protein